MGKCPICKNENFTYNDEDLCPDCLDDSLDEDTTRQIKKIPKKPKLKDY